MTDETRTFLALLSATILFFVLYALIAEFLVYAVVFAGWDTEVDPRIVRLLVLVGWTVSIGEQYQNYGVFGD